MVFPLGATGSSRSRWLGWQEMLDSVLTALRCPLSLLELIRRGPWLRWHFTIHRLKRPLQIEHVTKTFVS